MRRPSLSATRTADAWRRRRRVLAGIVAVQALLLAGWTLAHHETFGAAALDWAPLAAGVALVAGWRASDRRLRRESDEYLSIAGAMLLALDADGIIRMANRRLCETAGYEAEALIGRRFSAILSHHDDAAIASLNLRELLTGDRDRVQGIERRLVTAAGDVRLVRWDVAIRRDAAGHGVAALCSGEDITERRRQEDQLAEQADDLAGLRRLAQVIAASDDPRSEIVGVISDLAHADFAALVEPVGPAALQTTFASDPAVVGYEMPLHGDQPSGSRDAFVSGEPGFHADADGARRVNPEMVRRTGARSVMFQPVMVGGRPAAVLVAGWRTKVPAPGSRERELVALAADECSIALQRVASFKRLEEQALTDVLTGVPNRRAFDERLPVELSRARRSGGPLAVAMLDLNGFKALNDREGHEAGDRLLRATAAAWSDELRDTDTLARLGGDEFAVLLPDCGASEAAAVAERLRRAVPHASGSGVGVVVWDRHESAAALVARADRALYEDKARASEARLHDPERLAAVDAAVVGDRAELDEIARIGRWLLDVPTVVVSLVGDDRQAFLASCGLGGTLAGAEGVPLSRSICRHVVATGRQLLIEDAVRSTLLADHPAVIEDGVAAYAGTPLVDRGGQVVGVLCAFADEPRRWSEDDVATLRRLGERAAAELRRRALVA